MTKDHQPEPFYIDPSSRLGVELKELRGFGFARAWQAIAAFASLTGAAWGLSGEAVPSGIFHLVTLAIITCLPIVRRRNEDKAFRLERSARLEYEDAMAQQKERVRQIEAKWAALRSDEPSNPDS